MTFVASAEERESKRKHNFSEFDKIEHHSYDGNVHLLYIQRICISFFGETANTVLKNVRFVKN